MIDRLRRLWKLVGGQKASRSPNSPAEASTHFQLELSPYRGKSNLYETCVHLEESENSRCSGKPMNGSNRCIAHLTGTELAQALRSLQPGVELDVRGTILSTELLKQILRALQGNGKSPIIGRAYFDYAHFTGIASFQGVTFEDYTSFDRANFSGHADFDGAQFRDETHFDFAMFETASFENSEFADSAWFCSARFSDDGILGSDFIQAHFNGVARFDGAFFDGNIDFSDTKFAKAAYFGGTDLVRYNIGPTETNPGGEFTAGGATFTGSAIFRRTQFCGDAWFGGAKFTGGNAQSASGAFFEGVEFQGEAWFYEAIFAHNANLADVDFRENVTFGNAAFGDSVFFNGSHFARSVDFRGTQVKSGADLTRTHFGTARALGPIVAGRLLLDNAIFDSPVIAEAATLMLSCRNSTWKVGVTWRLRYAAMDFDSARFTVASVLSGASRRFIETLDDSHLCPEQHNASSEPWMPTLLSLRSAEADSLSVVDVDLSKCSFAEARLLDHLRIEGLCVFGRPPCGFRHGWAWPPLWRWSSRQTLAEEHIWRATTRKSSGWRSQQTDNLYILRPERLATLYRQVRKAQEDAKNEPGAADFYYGEMEMRRHARSTPRAERAILGMYWILSGYGLRATRALIMLGILITTSAIVLRYWGFPNHEEIYLNTLIYSAASVLSLNINVGALPDGLTLIGDMIRILLRIVGPVLLGLAALALRGRVKR